jgi:hypothetical protein
MAKAEGLNVSFGERPTRLEIETPEELEVAKNAIAHFWHTTHLCEWDGSISTAAELELARKAIEELRGRTVRHVSKHADRLKYPCEQTTREKAFADRWKAENDAGAAWRNYGRGLLEMLLCSEQRGIFMQFPRDLTPQEATAAATAIQWLGTNVGWCFLEECVKAAGYILVRKETPCPLKPLSLIPESYCECGEFGMEMTVVGDQRRRWVCPRLGCGRKWLGSEVGGGTNAQTIEERRASYVQR